MTAFRPGRTLAGLVLCVALGATAAAPARADDPAFITGSVGYYDMFDDKEATSFNFEYRSSYKLLSFLKPMVGMMATTDKAFYAYAGFNIDVYLGRRLVLSGNTAIGTYHDGDGKDLGSTAEFRSGMELAFRFDNRARLGVGFHHISNAGIGDSNPGTEILSLIFSWPLGNGN
jgi:hypothetical protein